ncbi:MAG: gluconate 2-dehydrogenase subunit 3 family protein [Bacteroidota bacterium]
MDRREAVRNMAFLMGGAISVTTMGALFESCNRPATDKAGSLLTFSADQQAMITEIADMIIPTTDTPGAKAAGVGPFITMMMSECYPDKAQKVFMDGLADVDTRAKALFSKGFMDLSTDQRSAVLKAIAEKTAALKAEDKKKDEADKPKEVAGTRGAKKKGKSYFFQIIRELTLLGYFTSEIGATKALVYLPVPGKYEGSIDLKPGQKAWAM